MATNLMVGLSRSYDVGAVALYPATNSTTERRLADAHIPVWHLNKPQGFDPRMFASLSRVFREFKPQIVHTHLAVQRYVFPVLLRKRGVVVHTLHNLAEHETDAFGRVVHWFAFRHSVLPVAISREVAASVKRTYGVECQAIIPNCIPVEDYEHNPDEGNGWRQLVGIAPNAIVFTCVGRLEPQKNPLLLLKAFSELKDPRAHLVLLGNGSLWEQVVAYTRSHNLGDRVHQLGKRENVSDVLAASDVFVLGSNWEGNPLAVMEAMAAGLPVIGTRVGGIPELVESGVEGLLVPAGDSAAFGSAMQFLLDNPERRLAMAEAARTRAHVDFKLERMVQGYSDFYRLALKASYKTSAPPVASLGYGS